ncbi:MAG: nitroreductase family protein, partial [Chitinivibrionales bacterium]|nr:nitroreductase family protein [Chitinivibrionales bacterium]
PLNLVYVADLTKLGAKAGDPVTISQGANCGFIAQNVYLYCASAGLVTVVRGLVDREELSKALKLEETHRVLLAQSVGWGKE